MKLEEAVRKMTSLPAERLRLTRRGRLAPGYFADITVFDAELIKDRSDFSSPHQYPEGVQHVFVNGVPAVSNGKSTATTAGRLLRNPVD